jgi:hypothetical protein
VALRYWRLEPPAAALSRNGYMFVNPLLVIPPGTRIGFTRITPILPQERGCNPKFLD